VGPQETLGGEPGRRSGLRRLVSTVALAAALAACGGNKSNEDSSAPSNPQPASRSEAAQFLNQASFGPTDAELDQVMALGYGGWIDAQFAKPQASHRATWESVDASLKAVDPSDSAGQEGVIHSFWKQAVAGDDQLRQRVAFALSQIFVISMQDATVGDNPRAVAAYLDMLGDKGFGNYRDLLESVSRHPMMGVYLSHLRNRKADARTGRVPDENYAREVMQLFSIGLYELEADGSVRTSGGTPVDTYGPDDIAGLAKVFTGWSWACPEWPDNACFSNGSSDGSSDPDRTFKSMLGYPQYHSTEQKTFLSATIPVQATADPAASLKTALDALYNHPNVGPFIGRQLIQRLVTSNPSPAYVAAVAGAFVNNGAGVRGDMKAVIKAVLTHPEARNVTDTSGKLREPVLRLAAFLRAFGATSDTGEYKVGNTDNPGTQLGQTPMRAPSVFNFYRPGFVPPGSLTAVAGLVSPEMQLAQETTAAGYVNYMRDNISAGVGQTNGTVNGVVLNRRDLRLNYTGEIALADQPAALVTRLSDKLLCGAMPDTLKAEIQGAIEKITIPAATGSNQTAIDTAKRTRVHAAILLTVVSPEYQVQK